MKIQIIKIVEKQKNSQRIIVRYTKILLIWKNEDMKVYIINPFNILVKRVIEESKIKYINEMVNRFITTI